VIAIKPQMEMDIAKQHNTMVKGQPSGSYVRFLPFS
jgi:hypothetical protein